MQGGRERMGYRWRGCKMLLVHTHTGYSLIIFHIRCCTLVRSCSNVIIEVGDIKILMYAGGRRVPESVHLHTEYGYFCKKRLFLHT